MTKIQKAVGRVFPPLGLYGLAQLKPVELTAYNAQHGTAHTKASIAAEIAAMEGK